MNGDPNDGVVEQQAPAADQSQPAQEAPPAEQQQDAPAPADGEDTTSSD